MAPYSWETAHPMREAEDGPFLWIRLGGQNVRLCQIFILKIFQQLIEAFVFPQKIELFVLFQRMEYGVLCKIEDYGFLTLFRKAEEKFSER